MAVPIRTGHTHPLLTADIQTPDCQVWNGDRAGGCCKSWVWLCSVDGEMYTFGALSPWRLCPQFHITNNAGRINSLPGRGDPDQLAQGGVETPPLPTSPTTSCYYIIEVLPAWSALGMAHSPALKEPFQAAWRLWLPLIYPRPID